jgi:4-amino-4-deoxy-L-arabinose transferase-like glycosyltransferase
MTTTFDQPTPADTNMSIQSGVRPRRTLTRLAWALAGVSLAGAGQYFFNQESLGDGLLFYTIGVVLFGRALISQCPTFNLQTDTLHNFWPAALNLQRGWRRNLGIWLMVVACGISILSFNLFDSNEVQPQAWWFYLGSLVLFVFGVLLMTRGDPWRETWQFFFPARYVWVSLLIVLGLALFMRLYHFGSQPFGIWFDEAQAGLEARQMLAEPLYRPVLFAPINISGHLLALYALALHWLGDTIYSMRLVSVMFGLGSVLAAFLFGRQLRGPRFGLLLAFLVAVMRWHVNFSRIAMTGIDTTFFIFLSLFFLTRLLQRGRLRDAMWAGLTFGLGLTFYTAFRLYVVAMAVFAVISIVLWWRWFRGTLRNGGWWAQLLRVFMLGIAVWLVVMPVVKFALDNPVEFWYRTNQTSILTRRDQSDLIRAITQTTTQHLLMFNFQGDRNGRHNLPAVPMLDPVMAVFFVLGIGLAVTRPRYPANTFFLLLVPLGLAGGILSVDFEAPQSLRSIAVIPAVIYFCGIALTALGREAEESLRPLSKAWVLVPAMLLLGYMLLSNAYTYFGRQANNFASWNAFSSPETIVGQKMAELGPDYTYFMSPFLADHPALHFLAPDAVNRQVLSLPDALPIRVPPDRPAVLFIHPDDIWIFDEAHNLYPNAKFDIVYGRDEEGDGPPVVYMVELQPTDLALIQGLELRYWPGNADNVSAGPQPGAVPLQVSRALNINSAWPAQSPVEENFVAEWEGVLYAPQYGLYNFKLVAPAAAELELDGFPILQGEGEQFTSLVLPQGDHAIRLRAASGIGEVALYWQPPAGGETLVPQWALYSYPVTNNGLLGTFFANDNWEGEPALQRVDPFLDTYFHFIPLRRPYTTVWTGWLDAPVSGVYRLGLRAVPEAELILDGQSVVTTLGPDQYTDATLTLEQGLHDITVRYKDSVDRSQLHLYWARPDGNTVEPIPSQYLWPPQGREPEQRQTVEVKVQPVTLRWLNSLGDGLFLEPRDVAVLANGNLVVADTGNRWVQIINPQGTFIQGLTGEDVEPFAEPLAVAVNSRDEILVLDSTLQWVYRYDAAGNYLGRFGGPTALLFHPRGMNIFEDDTIGLADTGSARVAIFNPDGSLAASFGQLGDAPGQFSEPTDVIRDSQLTYFVAEAMNNRIQHVDFAGNPLAQWAIPPAYAFEGPHLAFGPDGSIFVTESQSGSLFRYAPGGALLDHWQNIGPVTFAAPVGVYFDPFASRLYVTDVRTHYVHIFEVQ